MKRSYDIKVVALTIGTTTKWVDNLLSHHAVPGVVRGRQGMERRIGDDGLLAIMIVRLLVEELGFSVPGAAAIVSDVFDTRAGALMRFRTASGITLEIPAADIEGRMYHLVTDAIESIPRVRRGRPTRHR